VDDSLKIPPTPRYATDEHSPVRQELEVSPRRWLPDVPPTPRYEAEWIVEGGGEREIRSALTIILPAQPRS